MLRTTSLKNSKDAILCERKYFTPTIISEDTPPLTSNGIHESIFISKHSHWSTILLVLADIKAQRQITNKNPNAGLINIIRP